MNAAMPYWGLPLDKVPALRQDIADAVLSLPPSGSADRPGGRSSSDHPPISAGLSALLWAAFEATGCPYRTENTGFWSRKIIAKGIDAAGTAVWNDMVQFCRLVKKGTATAKQRERCCGRGGLDRGGLDLCTEEAVQRMKCVKLQLWPAVPAENRL